jgi:hypothetical protein
MSGKKKFLPFIISLLFYPLFLHPLEFPDENNSIVYATWLADKIIENPFSENILDHAAGLVNLAPYTGRKKIITVFDDAVKKLQGNEDRDKINSQVMNLLADELESGYTRCIKNFSVINRWNVSGPWTRYGLPDYNYDYQPEKSVKIENIEKGKTFLTGNGGEIRPFKILHRAGETAYITSSFSCEEGINLWVMSDSSYRLIVNGRQLIENDIGLRKEIKAFSLRGAKGYTIQLKVMSRDEDHHPCFRVMVTDEKNKAVSINYTSSMFNYSYTAEKLFSFAENEKKQTCKAAVLTCEMNEHIASGNYYSAYKLGISITSRYPLYAAVYEKFMNLLDIMNRDDEYRKTLEAFRKYFPESEVYLTWLAEFHSSRNIEEFTKIMKIIPSRRAGYNTVLSYINMLCGEKKYSEAIELCLSAEKYPGLKLLIPRIKRESGDLNSWRNALLKGISGKNEADYYYDLGLAEMFTGLDPVMYWKKGLYAGENPPLLRDISDIYENSILESNDYYKGIYTDFHPEFLWYCKKRKISLHVLDSGKIFFEGEDIIPSGKRVRKMKFADSGLEFTGTEIKALLPCIKGLKVIYVLSASGGLPSVTHFRTEINKLGGLTVKYNVTGTEEFSVIKYSGEYTGDNNFFMLANGLTLKSENEKMSDLEYEVFIKGDFIPRICYKGNIMSGTKTDEGLFRNFVKDRFADDDNSAVNSEIYRFSSDAVFSKWYYGIISGMGRYKNIPFNIQGALNFLELVKKIHFHVMASVSKSGDINFNPRRPDHVLRQGKGTVEEKTHLAKIILENKGIKPFISYLKNSRGFPEKILLFVPEKKGKGLLLDFYGDNPANESITGKEAFIITAEGYEKISVNNYVYIR